MPEEQQVANQRRRYFIDHKFQTDFVLKFCAVLLFSSVMIGVAVFYLAQSSTTVAIENTEITIKPTSSFILPVLVITIAFVTFFSSLMVMVMMVFISHRIAGPAYRLKKEIKLLCEGQLNRSFRMRRNDQLLELAEVLENLTKVLKEKHRTLQQKFDGLHHDIEALKLPETDERAQALKQRLRELKSALDYFKLQ